MMFFLTTVFAYLLGAVPFALVVARLVGGIDLRQSGSGNTGAMNTIRTVGRIPGIGAFVLDAAKGVLAMLVAYLLVDRTAAIIAGAAAIIGHCYSIWLLAAARNERGGGWKRWLRRLGGKGLATGLAVLFIWNWPSFAVMLAVFFGTFGLQYLIRSHKDETWPTVIALIAIPPLLWAFTHDRLLVTAGIFLVVAVLVKHLPDLREGYYVDR